eukprot:1182506-Amphidinium_carterae.2
MDPSLEQVREWTCVADDFVWAELGQDLSETGAAGSLLRVLGAESAAHWRPLVVTMDEAMNELLAQWQIMGLAPSAMQLAQAKTAGYTWCKGDFAAA